MLKKIDFSQEIEKDNLDTERAVIQNIIDRSPTSIKKGLQVVNIKKPLQVFALKTGFGNSNYGILVDFDIVDFEISTLEDSSGKYRFFKV